MFAHNFDSMFVVDQSSSRLTFFKKTGDLKISIIVKRIELTNVLEKLQCLVLILWSSGLTSFDLGEQPNGFVAILIAGAS